MKLDDSGFPPMDQDDVENLLFAQGNVLRECGYPDVGLSLIILAKSVREGDTGEVLAYLTAFVQAKAIIDVERN